MKHFSPVALPSLPPLRARLCNALLSRALPCVLPVDTGEGTFLQCCLAFDGVETSRQFPAPFAAAVALHIQTGSTVWKLTCSSLEALALQPDLAAWRAGENADESQLEEGSRKSVDNGPLFVPRRDFSALPQELRLAVLERLFAPALVILATWLGCEVRFCAAPAAEPEWAVPLPLTLRLPNDETVFLRLFWADEAAARFLLERLEAFPLRQSKVLPGIAAKALLSCPVEIGAMALSRDEVLTLGPGDILLPERWTPEHPRLYLPDGTVFVCHLHDGVLSLLGAAAASSSAESSTENTCEIAMSESAIHAVPEAAEAEVGQQAGETLLESRALAALELPVTFELASLKLRVDEVAALAPGLTFALGGDVASVPVLIRIGERPAARGRLVDVGGMPGVQITSLMSGDEEPAPVLPDVEGS